MRRLLKDKKAKAVKRCPFTIQLLYEAENNVQLVTLGVDAGSRHIGISATTEDKVLYEADVELRNDITSMPDVYQDILMSHQTVLSTTRRKYAVTIVRSISSG